MSRHLLFLTGTRADFGKLEPLAAAARDAGHRVTFFVTGMHMMDRYGLTKKEVQRMAGVAVHEYLNQRAGDPQDVVLAKTVTGFSDYLAENRPDLIVIHGDRIEALAGALVSATNYIPSAHVEGGEVSGTIDEVFRHCNTKLCTHHFVSSEAAKRRVMALGEPAEAIHVIGSPELDFHARPSGVTLDEVKARYAIPFADYGIVTFHPVTSEQATMGAQAQALFGALEASGPRLRGDRAEQRPGIRRHLRRAGQPAEGSLPGAAVDALRAFFRTDEERRLHGRQFLGRRARGALPGPAVAGHRHAAVEPLRCALGRGTAVTAFDRAAILRFLAAHWGRAHHRHARLWPGAAADRFVAVLDNPAFWTRPLQKTFRDVGGDGA
jgi:UDP-N-acetylglucosamine 2-epimerase (hydrolysing)